MKTTYEICKALVESKLYDSEDLAIKFDMFCGVGRISIAEYMELIGMISLEAPEPGTDSSPELEPTSPIEPETPTK